ncbi:MAG TPA: dynamin family protein [Gammaproteobacteria bacterium]
MAKEEFSLQLQQYHRWKTDIIKNIETYRKWVEDNEMSSPEEDLRMYETIDALKKDEITIAVAAEFSRGKSELINAIFFANYQRRLLPSSAGRTTMCPTELYFDKEAETPYIRMLPIETRLEDMSIAEYKQHPDHWISVELDIESVDSLVEAFKEIGKTKSVSREKAAQMGLYTESYFQHMNEAPLQIEIPMWRHVLISFPHPLLKQGLTILDTPGLNALGSEPELTMDMLPRAQSVMFVLAADTGATKSDMEIWQQYAKSYRETQQTGVLIVLNKIDTLWDELHDAETVDKSIQNQRVETAETLGVPIEDVYPVSAVKGLLAKIKKDDQLLLKSGLPALERALSEDILSKKQEIIRENIVSKIGGMVESTKSVLTERFEGGKSQLTELRSLSGKSADVLMDTMKKLRAEQAVYQKDVENFQTSRHVLKRQLVALNETLSIESLDQLISKTRESMVDSWTTGGMKSGMKTFFDGAKDTMTQVNWQVDKSNKLVSSIYDRFREEHGFTDIKPLLFSTQKYTRELAQLYEKADMFRKSPVTTMTEQSFVVKKFFVSMVSHARNIFFRANEDAENWAKTVLLPLAKRIKERKTQLEKRIENLQKVKSSREKIGENIQRMEKETADLEVQLESINNILDVIHSPLPWKVEQGNDSLAASMMNNEAIMGGAVVTALHGVK